MSLCVAAFLPRPFGFFLPVGCCPLCFAQKNLNVMSAVRHGYFPILDTSSSEVPAPVSNRLLFPVGCSPWAVLARRSSQNKISFFIRHVCTCRLHSPRCALITYTSVPLCTHRLHPSRSALIACIRHRGVVHSSPSFTTLCTHRFHAFATLCTHQLIAFFRHVHSSLPFDMLCTHRLHSPRCALIAFIRRAVHSSLLFAALCTHSQTWSGHIAHILSRCLLYHLCPLSQARLDGSCLPVL